MDRNTKHRFHARPARSLMMALLLMLATLLQAHAAEAKRILVIGDSMTGWMGERLNAYGETNGFEVATIVWDGSTIKKWGNSASRLKEYVRRINPDAVIVCLGLNECAVKNPETLLGNQLSAIKGAVGNRPMLWVGPPEWPGKPWGEPMNSWLQSKLGEGNFFYSHDLKIPRQSSTNPHPTRQGINAWTDKIVEWIPANASFSLPGYKTPSKSFSRGKTYIYKRMREAL